MREPLQQADSGRIIRDMVHNTFSNRFATLAGGCSSGTDTSCVKIWDLASLSVTASYEPADKRHVFVCMAGDETESDCLVLGSSKEIGTDYWLMSTPHLTMVDPRVPDITACQQILIPDLQSDVRSLSIRQHLITAGTGDGNIFFYDTRKPGEFCERLHSGPGWIRRDTNYNAAVEHHHLYAGSSGPRDQGIYTHAYSKSGDVLFTGGGPLRLGMTGSYGALWS